MRRIFFINIYDDVYRAFEVLRNPLTSLPDYHFFGGEMNSVLCAAHDATDKEWEELKVLYVKAFVAMSAKVSEEDFALMGNNPEQFWAGVLIVINHDRWITSFVSKRARK